MMEEPRRIPIHQSVHRPELVLGGEREPVMLVSMFCGIVAIVGFSDQFYIVGILAIVLYFLLIFLLRKAAKRDPMATKVFIDYTKYRIFYTARSSVWVKINKRY